MEIKSSLGSFSSGNKNPKIKIKMKNKKEFIFNNNFSELL